MYRKHTDFWGRKLQHRDLGFGPYLGSENDKWQSLYCAFQANFNWDPNFSEKGVHHRGIFNLAFSPEGSLLVAATEGKSILIFDPLNHKLIGCVDQAHSDCVNYARFLDSRMFATCSDDTTVALWDVRYLKTKIRSFVGHSNWVKNIEYASKDGLLVTSGFDGSIYTWDINKYSEREVQCQRIFHTSGLMRMRLTPDNKKMVICTTGGYLMIIHDLDLNTLAQDLQGFKPNMYRLMQTGNTPFPVGFAFNHLFRAKRNRVELIADFPSENDAEIISSLQVHPHGWCVLSRNTSSDENSEWTCVHDIQETKMPDEDESIDSEENNSNESIGSSNEGSNAQDNKSSSQPIFHIRLNYRPCATTTNPEGGGSEAVPPAGESQQSTESFRVGNIELSISQSGSEASTSDTPGGTVDMSLERGGHSMQSISFQFDRNFPSSSAPNVIVRERAASEGETSASSSGSSSTVMEVHNYSGRPAFFIRTVSHPNDRTYFVLDPSSRFSDRSGDHGIVRKVYHNVPRLLHYAREPNVGRGFIKELCFSTDGRLVCSPYGYGVRLFAFDNKCRELSDCVPTEPKPLCEMAANLSHSNYVLSTKFSPTHCLLVSGCLSGKICFHQPVFS